MSFLLSSGAIDTIPDSVIGHYAADELDLSDGSGVSSWPDLSGEGNDLSGSSPTFQTNRLNGLPTVSFDGTDDVLDDGGASGESSQPNTFILVIQNSPSDAVQYYLDSYGTSGRNRLLYSPEDSSWFLGAGSNIAGGSNNGASAYILTGVVDGSNSAIRENGTQVASGDTGTDSLHGISVGGSQNTAAYGEFEAAEIMVFDGRLSSSQIDDQEQRLADKWGLSLS